MLKWELGNLLVRHENVLKKEQKLPVDVRGSKTSVLKLSNSILGDARTSAWETNENQYRCKFQRYYRWTSQQYGIVFWFFISLSYFRTSIAAPFTFCRLSSSTWNYAAELWSSKAFRILHAQLFHARSYDVSDLSISKPISDFWQTAIIKWFTLRDIVMEMFKFSKFDLERATTKSRLYLTRGVSF